MEETTSPLPLNRISEASWFARGGLGLCVVALVLAVLHVQLAAIDAQALVLVMLILSVPLSVTGASLGGTAFLRQRRREGAAAVLVSVVHLVGLMSWGLPYSLRQFRLQQLDGRKKTGLDLLARLRMAAVSYRHETGASRFLDGASAWTPSRSPSTQRYMYAQELWQDDPWIRLGFTPHVAHFHQFRYQSLAQGQGFVVQARGDLDGDGQLATYTSTVWLRADGEVFSEPIQYWPPGAE
ncbi:MAG: hypothetical protein KTR25_04640 [Myxococcales bacterium]|nr:hypothetical protein [Myxococcales bacterium]